MLKSAGRKAAPGASSERCSCGMEHDGSSGSSWNNDIVMISNYDLKISQV